MNSRLRQRAMITLAMVACTAAVTIGTANAAPGPAVATTATTAQARPGSTLTPLVLPTAKAKQFKSAAGSVAASDNCSAVRAKLRQYEASGISRADCMTISHRTAHVTATTSKVAPKDAAWCVSTDGTVEWQYNRSEECLEGFEIDYDYINTSTGLVVGTAEFLINQDILLSPTSGIFVENDTFDWVGATGEGDVPQILGFSATCGGTTCTVLTGGSYGSEVAPFSTTTLSTSYEDTTATADNFQIDYSFLLFPPPGIFPAGSVGWNAPVTIRCDDELPGKSIGCALPAFIPYLQLSESVQGAGAVNVAIGENYLPGDPGNPSGSVPLTRVTDKTVSDGFRTLICGQFIPTSFVKTDSCDEYPFATTYQSGGANNLTGASCAEALPIEYNGVWYVDWFSYTGTEPCLIGHVPLKKNKAVGSALGVFVNANRILDHDPYWVIVNQ